MGHERFKDTLRAGSPSVDIGDQTAKNIVNQYRAMYPRIPILWSKMKDALFLMLHNNSVNYGPVVIKRREIELPSKLSLKYPNLAYDSGEFTYIKHFPKRTRTHGPMITENVVQALARIVMTDQMLDIQTLPEVDIVLQVHDEIIGIGSNLDADVTMEKIIKIMTTPHDLCKDLPLDAEGHISTVYDK